MRQEILKSLNKTLAGIEEKDIQYVITVPAIWEDKAKFFMRDAALEVRCELKISINFKHDFGEATHAFLTCVFTALYKCYSSFTRVQKYGKSKQTRS